MRAATPEKIALNALCLEYRERMAGKQAKDGRTAKDILGEMFVMAEAMTRDMRTFFNNKLRLDDDAFSDALTDKLIYLANWPHTRPDDFSNLLKTAMYRELIDKSRRSKRRRNIVETDMCIRDGGMLADHDATPLEHYAMSDHRIGDHPHADMLDSEVKMLKEEFKLALKDIPEKGLKILQLRLEGKTQQEIVNELRIPIGSVKSGLSDAKDRIIKTNKDIIAFIDDNLPATAEMDPLQRAFVTTVFKSAVDEVLEEKSAVLSR